MSFVIWQNGTAIEETLKGTAGVNEKDGTRVQDTRARGSL